jgi:GntR family transcriptional regulator / MocR family aminotransferase
MRTGYLSGLSAHAPEVAGRAGRAGIVFGILIERSSQRTLALQVADGLRQAVLRGDIPPGAKLPPSRTLSEELGISRRLITDAYEQLTSEGYLETRPGRGTFAAAVPVWAARPVRTTRISRPASHPAILFDFTPGIPDLSRFPMKAWRRVADESLSLARRRDLGYAPAFGDLRLREAIAAYLYRFRGLSSDPQRICVTSGTSQSLSLLAQLRVVTALYCEDPGLSFARAAFGPAGVPCRSLAVDEHGALPTRLGRVPRGSAFYLTPSHQFPTGALLSLKRRLAFLELATRADGIILEDDYDSEFRFRGTPVPPLASLDRECVVYLGTFSKCLAPFVRTGFLIVPDRLVEPLAEFLRRANLRGSLVHQGTMARFIEGGHLERHVFMMKRRYRARLEAILAFFDQRLREEAQVSGAETGFHICLRFSSQRFGSAFTHACEAEGLRLSLETEWRAHPATESDALVLGYGNLTDARLGAGLEVLARVMRAQGSRRSRPTAQRSEGRTPARRSSPRPARPS